MLILKSLIDWELAQYAIPEILKGLPFTLSLSLIGFTLGTILGFFIALMKMSRFVIIRSIANIHISLMRGIPLVVLLFLFYFGFPVAFDFKPDAISTAIVAFTIMSSAYISEIIRSSLLAIDKGQWDAAKSLGFSVPKTFQCIILPQATKISVPPLSNVLLDMVKGTSLTAMITIPEVFGQAQTVGGSNLDYMTAYICVAFIYWIICTLYAFGQNYLEKKLSL